MNVTMRKRIERAEALVIPPPPTFTGIVLIGRPQENASAPAWANYEHALEEAKANGCQAIVLVPLSPKPREFAHERLTP